MSMKSFFAASAVSVVAAFSSFGYNVRQPSDALRPKWHAADTAQGVWTLNVEDALQKARAAGKRTILLNTASWWCPFCETLEEKVLTSARWRDYVAENGFYLAMLDFPYRGHVTDAEVGKSYHPEFGDGWGFKCWLMNPEYLAQVGLSEEAGLQAIMNEYEMQKALGEGTQGSLVTITNCLTGAEFTYRKVGYPTLIVYDVDGKELGRTGFPWYSSDAVTDSEAQETVIQALELIINGRCTVCEDPLAGTPPLGEAQKYGGWVKDAAGGVCGSIDLKVGKLNGKSESKVSGTVTIAGKKVALRTQKVTNFDEHVEFAIKVNKQDLSLWVKFGLLGLTGEIVTGGEACCGMSAAKTPVYTIEGGRSLFKCKDDLARKLVGTCPVGTWSVVLKAADKVAPSEFSRGYGALSVSVADNGKAKIVGNMADGTKVGATSNAIVGDNGMACLPVYVPLYSKKGGFGFVIWFKHGKILTFEDVAPWVCADKKHPFTSTYTPTSTMSAGIGIVPEELDLVLSGLDGKMGGLPLQVDPSEDIVAAAGTKWVGTEKSGFTARLTKKTGLLKGAMTFLLDRGAKKPKKVKGSFAGIVLGGSGYGSVLVKGLGCWPVRLAACGACGD